jgi:hypothetical protein
MFALQASGNLTGGAFIESVLRYMGLPGSISPVTKSTPSGFFKDKAKKRLIEIGWGGI